MGKSIGYWAAWLCFGAWAIRCHHYYLMDGWWMVLMVFWFTASAGSADRNVPLPLRFLSLAVVTVAASFLIYGTFEWLQEIADGWSLGPPGTWQDVFAIPLRAIVAALCTGVLLVLPLRRNLRPYSAALLFIASLPVGFAEYGSDLTSIPHWRQHGLSSCIELFILIILPLILTAIDARLETMRLSNGRLANALKPLWQGEVPAWFVLVVIYPVTLAGVFWLNTYLNDLPKSGFSNWQYWNLWCAGWLLLLLLLTMGSVVSFRTLNRSIENGRKSAQWVQGIIVLVAAPYLLITVFGKGFEVGHSLTESAKAALGGAYQFQVPDPGVELRLSGEVAFGLADRLQEQLEAHPKVSRIRLESRGGDVEEASRAAKIIFARQLDTVVGRKCMSACTIMFVAGKRRTVEKDGQLGFHAARSPDPMEGAEGAAREAFIPYGLAKAFVSKVEATEPKAMWYPTREELVAAGVLSK
jgi:hypothetical protein